MYDLIIVGAGPVGSHLAKEKAGEDWEVLVIERSDEIGRPLACSGHVSPDIWNFVPEDAEQGLLQNRIKGARFHTGKNFTEEFYSQETVSYVIDRVELDMLKAEEAEKAGAEIHTGETVEEVEEENGRVKVVTDRENYESRYVAGCDGASSTVREEVGLPEPDMFLQGILCFTDEKDASDRVDVFLEVPEFFGWRIPRSDSVEYGAAVPRGEEPLKWLNRITEGYVEDERRENFCAGAIPVGAPDEVATDRVFLVGDAAAQTKPFTGGGILYGMRCAEIAAEALSLEDSGLEEYEQGWRSELGREMRIGELIRRSYSWPELIQRAGMNFFSGEIGVHMDRPTTLFSFKQLKSLLRD
ncbi:MAG: geranylgeranyl reductase family protein [Candidatus Nanohaloarchaea archaeon]